LGQAVEFIDNLVDLAVCGFDLALKAGLVVRVLSASYLCMDASKKTPDPFSVPDPDGREFHQSWNSARGILITLSIRLEGMQPTATIS